MPDILHRVGIKSPPGKVYEALKEERGLAGWWSKNVKAPRSVGAFIEFRFGRQGSNDMKLVELTPNKVRWQGVDGAPEWIGTEVICDLRAENGATVPLFVQRVWREQAELDDGGQPTNKRIAWSEIHIYRLRDGKVREHWAEISTLELLQQIGVMPQFGQSSAA